MFIFMRILVPNTTFLKEIQASKNRFTPIIAFQNGMLDPELESNMSYWQVSDCRKKLQQKSSDRVDSIISI